MTAKKAATAKAPTKTEVLRTIAEDTGLTRKEAAAVFESLNGVIKKSLGRRGSGVFTLPGLVKMRVVKKPATKAREGINPFTGEKMMFKAKPARKIVRVSALKGLKDMVWEWMGHNQSNTRRLNVIPAEDDLLAQCVANSPGGPAHVLLSDEEAEHIPGCNMAFEKSVLKKVGGFDPRFRAAGDDVDVCWELQKRGFKLGFHPGALVWHHRRSSLTRYWKQQVGYGKAEALLEEKWPDKYNSAGHVSWAGRIYGSGVTRALRIRPNRIYQGTWGSAPFQRLYQPQPGKWLSLPLLPEWYLVIAGLAGLSLLGSG